MHFQWLWPLLFVLPYHLSNFYSFPVFMPSFFSYMSQPYALDFLDDPPSTMLLCCPWKHIHNYQHFHSNLRSRKHCHYTSAICSFSGMCPVTFVWPLYLSTLQCYNQLPTVSPNEALLQSRPPFLALENLHKNSLLLIWFVQWMCNNLHHFS